MPLVAYAPDADQALLQLPRDKCAPRTEASPPDERSEINLGRGEISPGCCYADPGNVDRSRWMPSHPPLLTASSCGRPPTQGNVPYQDSEAGHGETVSVEDPHRQPHAASRNAHAELWLRSATVGRSRQTPCACRKSNPAILVMWPAEDWATKNVPG